MGASSRTAGLGFTLGVAAGAVFVLSDPRRRLLRPSEGPDERPWWRTALDATYPSTVGLAVLSAISLAFSAILAAVLAGIIGGLGVAGIVVFLLRFSP